MSKYFTPIDLPEPKAKVLAPDPETEELLDISSILDKIQRELEAIRTGASKIHSFAIQMVEGKTAVLVSFNRLRATPTRVNIRVFLTLVEQDISQRVAEHFTMMFSQKLGRI